MDYELITNNHHENNVALFKCWESQKSFYKKVAFSKIGNKVILNEKDGYNFFFSNTATHGTIEFRKKAFYEINIPEFEGRKFPFNYRFPRNAKIVEFIIEFYKTYWLDGNKLAVHGDLALSNIIYGHNNEMYIVDWEHFHIANSEYFGFDIIHLLFLTLYQRINKINNAERKFLKNCYNKLCDRISDTNKIFEKPFINSQKYMREFSDLFSLNVPIGKKFVLAEFPRNQLEQLDLLIT